MSGDGGRERGAGVQRDGGAAVQHGQHAPCVRRLGLGAVGGPGIRQIY